MADLTNVILQLPDLTNVVVHVVRDKSVANQSEWVTILSGSSPLIFTAIVGFWMFYLTKRKERETARSTRRQDALQKILGGFFKSFGNDLENLANFHRGREMWPTNQVKAEQSFDLYVEKKKQYLTQSFLRLWEIAGRLEALGMSECAKAVENYRNTTFTSLPPFLKKAQVRLFNCGSMA